MSVALRGFFLSELLFLYPRPVCFSQTCLKCITVVALCKSTGGVMDNKAPLDIIHFMMQVEKYYYITSNA